MEIKQMGSVRTYGGKAHLAYTFVGADGKEHFTVACSCKGTSNGQMQRGVFEIGLTTAAERKDVWVYKFMDDHWEFHGPNGFYWHGSADNAYDARAKGWQAWEAAQ